MFHKELPRKQCSWCLRPVRAIGQRYCLFHHAQAMKQHRLDHPLVGEARRRSNARSYLHTYIKRGKVKKLPCEICGNSKVESHHEDYSKPLKVRWLCRSHHLQVTQGLLILETKC